MYTPRLISVSLLLASSLVAGCASGYSAFYKPANGATAEQIATLRAAPAPNQPQVERARSGDADKLLDAYAKRGYIIIGSSLFNSARPESDDSAILQAKEIKADLVVILNPNYTGSITSAIPITTPTTSTTYSTASATAYGRGGPVTAYGSGSSTTYGTTTNYIPMTVHRSDYGAVYFVKQKFNFGAFFRDLNDSERQELQTNRGAVARLIVDGTPAFNADLLVGDIFVAIDGVAIASTQALSGLLRERRGRLVDLSIMRRGQKIQKSVQLNP